MLLRHRTMLWRMCMRRARGNSDICRDLVQEVSLSLWEHYDNLRPNVSLLEERAWVFWHTRTVLDHLYRRNQLPLQTIDPVITDTYPSPDSDNTFEDLMGAFPTDDQRLVRMRVEGYDANEIASALGISRDAVYQRLHRIIIKLRKEQYEK